MLIAALIALASSAFFATGSALQHRAAGSAPRSSKLTMLAALVARPSWLLGTILSATAFVLHATALHLGDLAVVQPVILSGIVFTVIVRSALSRKLPSRHDVLWSLVTWAGLSVVVAALAPGPERAPAPVPAMIMSGTGAAVVLIVAVVATVTGSARRRALLLGTAAGILFGLVAGLVKMTLADARGVTDVISQWSLWLLLGLGGWAVLLNQRAYQTARVAITVPILNLCQLAVGLAFGWVVFDERPAESAVRVVGELVGLIVISVGVIQLARRGETPT